MKMKQLFIFLVGISLLIITAGCSTSNPESNNNSSSVEKTLYVGPERVDCVGVAPQKCYKVKENPADEWTFFYSEIAGFEYEPGFEYELLVREEKVENPPADGSSLRWELIEIISKDAVTP